MNNRRPGGSTGGRWGLSARLRATTAQLRPRGDVLRLAVQLCPMSFKNQIDPLANIHDERNLRSLAQELKGFVLFRGEVNSCRNFLAGHGRRHFRESDTNTRPS